MLRGFSWVMVMSVVVAIASVGVIRMMPDPERTMNLGGEYFGMKFNHRLTHEMSVSNEFPFYPGTEFSMPFPRI